MKRGNIIKAAAHITGGGLPGNVERVVPHDMSVHLDALNWNIPPVFSWIQTLVCLCFYYYYYKFNYHGNFRQIHWHRFNFVHSVCLQGNISQKEMLKTFNCGVGMVVFVDPANAESTLEELKLSGVECSCVGYVCGRDGGF